MKYFKVFMRGALVFIFSMANLYVNLQFCLWAKPRIPAVIPFESLAVIVEVLLFIYFLAQIGLVLYLNYRGLASGCKKHGIPYR